MSEMIYGNTGRRDEGINIDNMDHALYQKLQSRTFVPKLKSLLNDHLQEGDKSFVFIGDVAEKFGSFSVYGYNAKLANDSRGGDYGHYIAVPSDQKSVSVDTNNVSFLTEEGFVEYVNLKNLNNDKRFKILPSKVDIDVNAKKIIVNNLMETFMRVRKRKNVSFTFSDNSIEEFTSKSLYVLIDLMKYIPFRMRKNISFISHVASNQKLPDMINLAAYPASSEFKPHDCISIDAGINYTNEGAFAGYVEKVFSMTDEERTAYFEKIYTDIETPAILKNIDVKSDLYLLDISTKQLWTNGDIDEAVSGIFSSVDDVLKVYPLYKDIAAKRLSENQMAVVDYIKNQVVATNTTDELKAVYNNVQVVFEVCDFNFSDAITDIFKTHATGFIQNTTTDQEFINTAESVVSIKPNVLNNDVVISKFNASMSIKPDLSSIFTFYLDLKGSAFINDNIIPYDELKYCLIDCVEKIICINTDEYAEHKEKLVALKNMYTEFTASFADSDYSHVTEVYDSLYAKFGNIANDEAVKKGNNIVYDIERELNGSCNFFDLKNFIISLAGVEVKANENLKQKTSDIYKKVSFKMFEELSDVSLSYDEFKQLIQEISPAVRALDANEIYDDRLSSGWGEEKYVSDGMFRFVTIFESMIQKTGESENLTNALLAFDEAKKQIKDDEYNLTKAFEKFAPAILSNWLKKHKKSATSSAFKKSEKEIKKRFDKPLSSTISRIFETCINDKKGKKKLSLTGKIIIIVASLIVIAALVIGGLFVCKHLFGNNKPTEKKPQQTQSNSKPTISATEKNNVEKYLNGIKEDKFASAEFVVGKIIKPEKTDDKKTTAEYTVSISNSLGSAYKQNSQISATDKSHTTSKKLYSADKVEENVEYAVVLQKSSDGKTVYIRDIFDIPTNFKEYDFSKTYSSKKTTTDADKQFVSAVVKFVGYKANLLTEEQTKNDTEEGSSNEQKAPQKGEEQGSKSSKETGSANNKNTNSGDNKNSSSGSSKDTSSGNDKNTSSGSKKTGD